MTRVQSCLKIYFTISVSYFKVQIFPSKIFSTGTEQRGLRWSGYFVRAAGFQQRRLSNIVRNRQTGLVVGTLEGATHGTPVTRLFLGVQNTSGNCRYVWVFGVRAATLCVFRATIVPTERKSGGFERGPATFLTLATLELVVLSVMVYVGGVEFAGVIAAGRFE